LPNRPHEPGRTDLTQPKTEEVNAGDSGERRRFAMREAASFIASRSGSAEAGVLQAIVTVAQNALKSWSNRRQIANLAEFDDHMLADIGLSRADVRETLDLPFSHDLGRELQLRATRNHRRGWNR
jgi:uncharacterized protein YjiS (DUF1127 family)